MWVLLAACRPGAPSTPLVETTWDPDAPLSERCFAGLGDPDNGAVPQYDAYEPVVPRHCVGTDHQEIEALDRVVFLGDSITAGTPPTPADGVYRELLTASLQADFGPLETQNCSEWGARADDLLQDGDQLVSCLGADGIDERATLVVFTVGGNDVMAFAEDLMAGEPVDQVTAAVDETIAVFDQALDWLVEAQARFPNGLYVVFGNVYEYTDGTGDLSLCPAAELLGFSGAVPEIRAEYVRLDEAWVRLAVEHGFDVAFLLESFCGHGFLAGDPENECYRGPDAEVWFDASCIHPNPVGHQQIADQFLTIVRE
jgi:hypothetical protein